MVHVALLVLRLVGIAAAAGGIGLLGREQAITVSRGLPARPRFIALWLGVFGLGCAVAVVAILGSG